MAGEITTVNSTGAATDHDSKSVVSSRRSDSPEQATVRMEFDAAVEKRLIRKLDRRLVLIAFLCYLAAFLDRSNIGNAQTAGMGKDLGFDDDQYEWLLTIFYIAYIAFEPLVLMYKIVPPHIWCLVTVMIWGVSSIMQAAAFNWQGLMACRFFLAAAEAGFGPAPLATTFAGALAYGITSGHYAIASWRLLFIIEAIPSLILAVVVFYLLPDSAATANFLTEEEKALARARTLGFSGNEDTGTTKGLQVSRFDFREGFEALKTPQAWIQSLMYFSCNVAFASLPVFLPAILTGMGFTSVNAQGLTAPPYLLAFLICVSSTWLGDRLQQRGLLITILSLVGFVGYVLLAISKTMAIRYMAVFFASAGVFPAIANILSWTLNNQRGDTKRGVGIAIMNVIGQCGPLLGTRVFPTEEGPYYVKGMAICAGFMFLNAALAFGLRTYFKHMNDRWDREMRTGLESSEGVTSLAQDQSNVGGPGALGTAGSRGLQVGWENSTEWRYAL